MNKVKKVFPKSALDAVKKASTAMINLQKSMFKFNDSVIYLHWLSTFKPQSQRVINVILITVIVLALAEIVWFVVTKY